MACPTSSTYTNSRRSSTSGRSNRERAQVVVHRLADLFRSTGRSTLALRPFRGVRHSVTYAFDQLLDRPTNGGVLLSADQSPMARDRPRNAERC
jgi:hypothetical protein